MQRAEKNGSRGLAGSGILIGILAFHLVLIGCSKDKATNPTPPTQVSGIPATILGTWKLQSASVQGYAVSLGAVLGWHSSTTSATITVGSDSSLVYEEQDAQNIIVSADTARFSIRGDQFVATPGALPSDSGSWSVTGSELALSGNLHGYNYEIKATKKV